MAAGCRTLCYKPPTSTSLFFSWSGRCRPPLSLHHKMLQTAQRSLGLLWHSFCLLQFLFSFVAKATHESSEIKDNVLRTCVQTGETLESGATADANRAVERRGERLTNEWVEWMKGIGQVFFPWACWWWTTPSNYKVLWLWATHGRRLCSQMDSISRVIFPPTPEHWTTKYKYKCNLIPLESQTLE